MKLSLIRIIILIQNVVTIYSKHHTTLRIVNGHIARKGLYPFMVNIWKDTAFLCGGTILNTKWVLTGAHCLKETQNDHTQLKLYAGSLILGTGTQYDISKGVMHNSYSPTINDIGLLKIKTNFVFSDTIQPIKVNNKPKQRDDDYMDCVLPGWGRDVINGRPTLPADRKLRYVEVSILDHSVCFEIKQAIDAKNQMCGTGTQQGSGACLGDSGGPLVCDNIQVGIVSYGRADCGSATWHSMGTVFTRVSAYCDWITKNAT